MKLRMCQIWEQGSQLYDGRTDGQKRAEEIRKRHDKREQDSQKENQKELKNGDVK